MVETPSGGVVDCTLSGHLKAVSTLCFSPSGQYLATGSADSTIKIWSLVDRLPALTLTLRGHTAGVNEVGWSSDSVYLASCSDDQTVKVWNVVTGGTLIRDYAGQHTSYVLCLAWNPQSTLIVSGGFDETVRLWNVSRKARTRFSEQDGERAKYTSHRTIAAHSEAVSSVGFNRDGTMIVSASYDGLIRLWDTTTGQCLKTLVHKDKAPLGSVQFSPNSSHLLCTSLDHTVRLWDLYNAKVLKTYTAHTNAVYPVKAAFYTHDSTDISIVAASEDDTNGVYFYDLQSKVVTHTLTSSNKHTTIAIALHPTLPLLATASLATNTVTLWHLTY